MKLVPFLAVILALSGAIAVAAAPVGPAGTWLVPSTHAAPLDIHTSIGVLALKDERAKDGYPFTSIALNGKRLLLDGDGRFDSGRLEIERVLDFGGHIDLVYSAGCGGSASACHQTRSIAQVDRSGRIGLNVSAQQDWERAPDASASDNDEDWSVRSGVHAMVLGRKGNRVREMQLSPTSVRIVVRAPLNPGELAALRKLEQER
jgi:hypothetical protein